MPKYSHSESQVAENIISGHWHWDTETDLSDLIRTLTVEQKALCVLQDIAVSLRVLRCQNFKDIPHILKTIRGNTGRIPRKEKGK